MLKITSDTKLYVHCPANVVTGGAELLHQLVDKLRNYSLDAYIIYSKIDAEIPTEYSSYNIKTTNNVIDDEQNIIVIYEGIFDKAFITKKAQIILWWLSVDNFYYCSISYLSIYDYLIWKPKYGLNLFMRRIAGFFIKQRNIFNYKSLEDLKKIDAVNCYQSEYAQNFLINKGFMRMVPLTDYINSDLFHTNTPNKRDNIILYNPKKGYKFTKKIIDETPMFTWKPLIGMNRQELVNAFQQSKLYVDFGYHPGKDRIPREAAINGCCIITGMQGSAKIYEDVSIPNYYKIDEQNTSVPSIVNLISEILQNYENHILKFEYYRNKIKREETEFDYQIRNIFSLS